MSGRESSPDLGVALDSGRVARGRCADPDVLECGAVWLPDDEERWRAYHGGDDLDEPAELFFYCSGCAASEFDSDLATAPELRL
jgi:hypothetical protein